MSSLLNQNPPNDNQISSLVTQNVKITAAEWGAKAKGKTECYHLLSHEWGAYLPHPD